MSIADNLQSRFRFTDSWRGNRLIYEGKGKIAFRAFFSYFFFIFPPPLPAPLPYYRDSTSKKGKFGTYYTTNEPNEICTRFSGKEPKCLFLPPEGLKSHSRRKKKGNIVRARSKGKEYRRKRQRYTLSFYNGNVADRF